MFELMNKQKIRADDYIIGFLIITYIVFAVFFKLEWVMSIIVYPFMSLFIFGILNIQKSMRRRPNQAGRSINKFLLGVLSIIFSVSFLIFIFIQPSIKTQNMINLIAYPLVVAGIAGIIKGIHISVYSIKQRIINIIGGGVTILLSLLALFTPVFTQSNLFLIQIVSLTLVLFLNIISRAALYLSEFGLSLIQFRNFKLFFYIISSYLVSVDKEGNIILDKIR
ncbi:MAG: hypothetical protein ACW986_06140 [Promethearchaeota archaeon]|jgi:hypothetical protein